MLRRVPNVCLMVMPLVLLIAMSAPAHPADNATITGDGVRLRAIPSVSGKILGELKKGTRVEVTGTFDFSDTVNGYTAPWYGISHGDVRGFVFGRYIALDSGLSVPPMEDPITFFVATGLNMLGGTEAEVIKKLGEPASRAEERYTEKVIFHVNDFDRFVAATQTLSFNGVAADFVVYEDGGDEIQEISYTSGAYTIWGLKVGSSVSDVRRLLGPPDYAEGEVLKYINKYGDLRAMLRTRNGTVVEITLYCVGEP